MRIVEVRDFPARDICFLHVVLQGSHQMWRVVGTSPPPSVIWKFRSTFWLGKVGNRWSLRNRRLRMPRIDPSRQVSMFPPSITAFRNQKCPEIEFSMKIGWKSTKFHVFQINLIIRFVGEFFQNYDCGAGHCKSRACSGESVRPSDTRSISSDTQSISSDTQSASLQVQTSKV